jgi:predicted GIY-YIG superfamily endonuclease
MRNHDYWVYILTNKHCTTLYIGITNNITRRLGQHRCGEVVGFTKRYHLDRLVWLEHFRDVRDAIACEIERLASCQEGCAYRAHESTVARFERRLETGAEAL